jgi:glycosyltransferase involved in cell wall biosynthesis
MIRTGLDILFVGNLPPHPGGAAISWAQLLREFAKRGAQVRAVAPITESSLQAGDTLATTTPEIEVSRFVVPHYYTAPDVPASDEYRRLERESIHSRLSSLVGSRRPDLILAGRETYGLHAVDFANAVALPCVVGIRGNTMLAILARTYPDGLATDLLASFRKANRLVAVAKHMADGLRTLGFDGVAVVPNAVDLTMFTPRPKDDGLVRSLGLQSDDIVVLHASNLKPAKRSLDLIASAEQALRHDPRLLYVVVGDGAARDAMEAACRRAGTHPRFRFVGWVNYANMPQHLSLADLVVMPSRSEGMSRVYLETQACGRLLLASDIPAAREVVRDGETGLLFPLGDIDELTEKTLKAASRPDIRAAIGQRAAESVKTHDLDRAVDAYLAIFDDLVT